jgi:transposase-like protein
MSLQRKMNIGSYQTAWMMLNRYRWAMSKAGHDKLSGNVEVDVTTLGGVKAGKRGKGAHGKVFVAIAVELLDNGGFGRCRLHVIPVESTQSMRGFMKLCIEEGSHIISDKNSCYPGAVDGLFTLTQHNISGDDLTAHEVLPAVHRVASLLKRWFLGTYQGSFGHDHVGAYLDEFTFRFNRRNSRQRGLLFYRLLNLSVEAKPLHYRDVVVNSRAKYPRPKPPEVKRVSAMTLQAASARQVWRKSTPVP